MNFYNKHGVGSEHWAASALRRYMHSLGWHTEKTHGNAFQKGFPDLICFHPTYHQRWVETKKSDKDRLTKVQVKTFTLWSKYGARIYVLTGVADYDKLFQEPNWVYWL